MQSSEMEVLDFSTMDSSRGPPQLVHTRPVTGLDWNKQQPGKAGPVACVKSCVWHSSDMPPQSAKGPGKHDMAFPLRGMCQQLIPRPFQGELHSKQVAWIHLAGYLFTLRYRTLLKAYCQ